MSIRIVFFGTPDFSVPILESLHLNFDVVGVVTRTDKSKGRGRIVEFSAVKRYVLAKQIPLHQPNSLTADSYIYKLQHIRPDLIVVAAYGKILPKWILELPEFGCINVHASLLPRWRGASPIQSAILHGDKQTGITIMQMEEGLDTGPILDQKIIPIDIDDTYGSLSQKLSVLGSTLIIDSIHRLVKGLIEPKAQNDIEATFTRLIKKTDGKLDVNISAEQLERQVRAFNPSPGCFFEWNQHFMKIFRVLVSDQNTILPGERGIIDKKPALGTATQDLVLLQVQLPGKNIISGDAFLNGYREWMKNE